jgi:hypothetical protein
VIVQPTFQSDTNSKLTTLSNIETNTIDSTIKVNKYHLDKRFLIALTDGSWIHDLTIEAYLSCFATIGDCFIMPSTYGTEIFYQANSDLQHSIDINETPIIMGPICKNQNHWCCFYANFNTLEFYYINPFVAKTTELQGVQKNCRKFVKQSLKIKVKFNYPLIEHSIQKDTRHCGVYVCNFSERLWESKLDGLRLSKITKKNKEKYIKIFSFFPHFNSFKNNNE